MQLLTIGWAEVLLIALIVLLLFGAKKIPELMKAIYVQKLREAEQNM